MAFIRRKIDLKFQLGTGAFGEGGFNTVELSGLRVKAQISKAGGDSMGEANVRVMGLTKSLLNQLSALNRHDPLQQTISVRRNVLSITAGDDEQGMGLIFEGQIDLGQIDMSNSPESALVLICHAGSLEALKPVAPSSYPGSANVADIMKNLAALMGLQFENNGVSVTLATPYLQGTARDQAMRVARAANINWVIDNGILAIWPKKGSRSGSVPLISPETGMVGYPAYSDVGIGIKTIFNPFLTIGQAVEVKSSLDFANGQWLVFNLTHELESETPSGAWFTSFSGQASFDGTAVAQ